MEAPPMTNQNEKIPYVPPSVESVELSQEAAEALT